MEQYIPKSAVVAEIERIIADETESIKSFERRKNISELQRSNARISVLMHMRSFLDTLEAKDPYEQCIQYASIEDAIKAHAEVYSFNIESELFNQLTKEQQTLWRKEIEQACISGGDAGVELARDIRYKENVEVKEVNLDNALSNLDKNIKEFITTKEFENESALSGRYWAIAKHAFLLGLKTQKGE